MTVIHGGLPVDESVYAVSNLTRERPHCNAVAHGRDRRHGGPCRACQCLLLLLAVLEIESVPVSSGSGANFIAERFVDFAVQFVVGHGALEVG